MNNECSGWKEIGRGYIDPNASKDVKILPLSDKKYYLHECPYKAIVDEIQELMKISDKWEGEPYYDQLDKILEKHGVK